MASEVESHGAHSDDLFDPNEWLSAAEALSLLTKAYPGGGGTYTLAKRAHVGLIRTHADLFVAGAEQRANVELPKVFWWAEGQAALDQNWTTGDFETWLEQRTRLQAFGVKFHKQTVLGMLPHTPGTTMASAPVQIQARGRPRSEAWPHWVAELVAYIHEEGMPAGEGTRGQDELIAAVEDRLSGRGLEAPSRTTVQETAKAVLLRLREPENGH
ncbi:MAG: hypothetical protein U1A07_25840 [Phenylobacterium sp.]|jgi:hypothetical protein|nr:hypothetical protein [Phenylobacterium sp.]MDZ4322208.1 hypothetical protein [Phenylobacterium sp.]